ncbi:MAG: T9SS type A sorting domain-containing protein, partial [Flavobacteriales bacterium]
TSTFLSDFWEYDPVADAWNQKASFPYGARYNTWQFVLNGIAYVGGGNSAGASGPFHADTYTYNPNTNAWASSTAIPDQGRHGAIGFTMNGKGYVVCGRESSLSFIQDLWAFDPASGTWSAMAPFPGSPRSSPLVFVYYNDVVVGCGRDGSVNHYDAWAYSATTNSWSQITSYPGATAMAGTSFSIGNRAYGGLGWDLATDQSHSDLWELIKPGNVSVAEQDIATNIFISPNPAGSDGFRIESRVGGVINARLLSSDGRLLDEWGFQHSLHVPTARLAKGTYLVSWRQGNAQGTARIIVH